MLARSVVFRLPWYFVWEVASNKSGWQPRRFVSLGEEGKAKMWTTFGGRHVLPGFVALSEVDTKPVEGLVVLHCCARVMCAATGTVAWDANPVEIFGAVF